MAFKLGLVGLCTSHPNSWVPILRNMVAEGQLDLEIVAAWDSGETRPAGFAQEFCRKFDIPLAAEKMEDLIERVDGVIIHTTNWDRHVEQARPFVEADKSVLLDKPLAGNLRDLNRIADWVQTGARITGGSSLRCAPEIAELMAQPAEERGEPHTAYMALGNDDYNYGIHGYAAFCGLFGGKVRSARYIGSSRQKHILLTWADGSQALYTCGESAWLPFKMTVVTTKNTHALGLTRFYETFLGQVMPYLCDPDRDPPFAPDEWMAPEMAALAARQSWLHGGREVFLTDLSLDDPGFDGHRFAADYRRKRLS